MKIASIKLSKKQKIIYSVVAGVLAIVISLGVFLVSQIKAPNIIDKDNTGDNIDSNTVYPTKTGDVYTFLFAVRDHVGLNTDAMMVISFDTKDYTVNVLNIPRDTSSADVSRSLNKINAAFGVGGKKNPDQMKKEVTQIIGSEIDRYAVISIDMVVEIIDLIGGVEIDVPKRMYYSDPGQDLHIDLKPGLQVLDGEDAMGFVRYRSYATGDLGRIEAQQIFISALLDQALTPSTITKVPDILDAIFSNMDTDFTMGEMVWLAKESLNINLETGFNISMLPGVPGESYVKSEGRSLSFFFAEEEELLLLLNEQFNPHDSPITADDIKLGTKKSRPKPAVEKNPAPTKPVTPTKPDVEKPDEPIVPPKPDVEKPDEPTIPPKPDVEKPDEPTIPTEPDVEKPDEPIVPSEPDVEKPDEPTIPTEPDVEKPDEPTTPTEPDVEKPTDPIDPPPLIDPELG